MTTSRYEKLPKRNECNTRVSTPDDAFFLNAANSIRVDGEGLFCLTINVLNYYRERYIKTKDKRYWWQLIQLLPSSYNQTRNVMLNYEVLANIYRQRKNHKLDEWREVCKWIESLPYSELITVDSREAIKEELRKEIMKARKFPAPWEAHGTAEYAKIHPDQLITIAEMEADARRAIKEE